MGDLSGCSIKTMMPTTYHHPLMKLSIKLMRVLIIVHSSLSAWYTIHYTGLSPSWSYRIFWILSQMSFCGKSDITSRYSTFPPFSPSTSTVLHYRAQHLRFMASECMCSVTDYRAHSLMPSAAVCESVVTISFQERQAEGQRATLIYIRESHSNSLMHTVTKPKHQTYTTDPDLPTWYEGHQIFYSGRE